MYVRGLTAVGVRPGPQPGRMDLYNAELFKNRGRNKMNIKSIEKTPSLLPVPPAHRELRLRLSESGVTRLKDGTFRTRYTGSKAHAVDINGNFWASRSRLAAHIKEEGGRGKDARLSRGKKKPRVETQDESNEYQSSHKDSERAELSKKIEKEYRVNKTEVRSRVLSWIRTARGKKELYFWTVTFPKGTSDDFAYQLYNNWLTTLRQKKFLRNYIWVAERQQNGTVHFHLLIPHKMSVKAANGFMRQSLMTMAREGKVPIHPAACKRYNGIDIAKNRKTGRVTNFAIKKGSRALANYLTKYATKNDGTFTHLAWHNSRGFSALFTGITMTIEEFKEAGFMEYILFSPKAQNDFFAFYAWRTGPPGRFTDHLTALNNFVADLN